VKTEGERLAEEADLPDSSCYMDETEQLQLAFGITPLERMPADACVQAASFVDRTDYSASRKARAEKAKVAAVSPGPTSESRSSPAKRPWWRIW
jgi:hypothetical protein